jgi:uncharacterized protein (DUF885 family)
LQQKKFEIRRTEAFREKTASAEYSQGTDGSRPGVFMFPHPRRKRIYMYGDEDLFLHEAIGHHFQIFVDRKIVHYQILENIIGLGLW